MIVYVEEAYDKKPDFDFSPSSESAHDKTCINVTRDGDSITFEGKLTQIPTKFAAALKNGTNFIFIFGKEAVVESTVQPNTEASQLTAIPEETQSAPQEETTLSGEPNGNENSGSTGGGDHDTVPTTSSGSLGAASVVVLFFVFTPIIIL